MKQKIYIGLIIFLLLGISVIQHKIFNFQKDDNEEQGAVKSAQIDKHSTATLEIENLKLPPINKSINSRPSIKAKNYILTDADSAYSLIEKDADTKVPIASTTKIMTAVVVLENYNLDDVVAISKNAATQIGSDVYLQTNEKISVKNLLYALLIKSGNDAAMALAEKIGKDKFISKMNEKAKYLGMNSTNFKDPAGLDDSGYSTAKDLAVLTAYALRNDEFKNIIKITEKTVTSIDGKIAHKLESSNRLIKPDEPLFYAEAIGVKTGFTPNAGHCLVAAAKKNNNTIISVILYTFNNTKDASARESKKLLRWGLENYQWD